MDNFDDVIDVIIPAYNAGTLLNDAINSVLGQTYKNIRILVVDDGSNDGGATQRYVRSLKDKRIAYLRKTNGGPSSARNAGLEATSAPYVAFLDADDYWEKTKLEKQLKLLKSMNHGMVYGLCEVVDNEKKYVRSVDLSKEGDLYRYLFSGNKITGSASMVLVRREVFDSVGKFREDLTIGEDWELWVRVAQQYTIGCVREYLATIRDINSSAQKSYLKVAVQLEKLFVILINEQRPPIFYRSKLGSFCFWESAMSYYNAGDVVAAKRVFLKSLLYNPLYFLAHDRKTWSACIHILLSNKPLRSIRRKLSKNYRER